MSLAKRIIPVILHKHGQMVKGRGFKSDRVVWIALQASIIHASRHVDELILLDVTATQEGREPDYALIKKLANDCFSPLTVGGGISKDEHVRGLLNSGADKVIIGTAAQDEALISTLAQKYGSQCIAVAVDVRTNHVYLRSGSSYTGIHVNQYVRHMEKAGAGEIILTAIDLDGTLKGYDLALINRVAQTTRLPVVAAGGCGSYEDMRLAIEAGADAVAAGALW